jgi:hypothetical protein
MLLLLLLQASADIMRLLGQLTTGCLHMGVEIWQ